MDQSFLDLQKAKLDEELQTLEEAMGSVSSPDKGDHVPGDNAPKFPNYGDDNYGENSESPAEVSDYTVNVSVTGHLEGRHKEVVEALKAVEGGTYGTCTKCGGAISEDRLKANPAAGTCMKCAVSHTA